MKRGITAIALVALMVLAGCKSAEDKALFAAVDLLCENIGGPCLSGGGMLCLDGAPFKGGQSLIVSCDCSEANQDIYWAKDGVLYTVNDAAKAKAPTLTAAPPEISAVDILIALDGGAGS